MHGLATTGTQYKHFYNTTLQKHTNFMQGWDEMGEKVPEQGVILKVSTNAI